MIRAQHLTKTYETVTALRDVSFGVNEKELFGFIGPDGAGKTTLFRILTTLMLADSGSVSVFGQDVVKDFKAIRHQIGYMPGRFSLYQDLSVQENLQFFASVFGATIDENYDLIKHIYSHIEPFKTRLAGNLSGGMKQKLALSCALVHRPRLLVLDEPTTGVDAVSRTEFWQMLHELKSRGITIIVSTPYMDEAGQCDRVALMQNGSIMSIDTPRGIVEQFDKRLWAVRAPKKYELIQMLENRPEMESVHPFGDSVHITTQTDELDTNTLRQELANRLNSEVSVESIQPNIEDCFLRLMQKD